MNSIAAAPVIARDMALVAGQTGNVSDNLAFDFGPSDFTLGWQLIAWFLAFTAVIALVDLVVRRLGGWRIQHSARIEYSGLTRVPLILGILLVVALWRSGTTGFLLAGLGLTAIALFDVMRRVPPDSRRRYLAGIWLWVLLLLALSVDLTNDRLGPIALFDHPVRMLALVVAAAIGGFVLSGWMWPASVGVGWLSAVIGAELLVVFEDGSARYLDTWRILLVGIPRTVLFGSPYLQVLRGEDLAAFALVGTGLMMAGGAVAWAVGSPPRLQFRRTSFWLLVAFIFAATAGVITDDAISDRTVWVLVAGLAIGAIVPTRLAFAITIGIGVALSTGAASGILLARGLDHAWEAPECDGFLSFCSPFQFSFFAAMLIIASLILTLVGMGIGWVIGGIREARE